jgi:putative pyrroloquinoline-quinone binding quinoprotein
VGLPHPTTAIATLRAVRVPLLALACLLALAGCSSGGGQVSTQAGSDEHAAPAVAGKAATGSARDWGRYGFNAQRSNVGPSRVGFRSPSRLRRHRLRLPGTVDSSPIYLHGVRFGSRRRDVFFVTTTYGRTLAIDARRRKVVWRFVPASVSRLEGSPQFTTATPIADPNRRYIYAASPDGKIHKLSVRNGREARGWPVTITRDPTHEKIASALNLVDGYVIAVTGGYIGDAPPYQGHVVAISRSSARIAHVFNTLCSDRRSIIQPSSCGSSDSAIWARAGAVVVPGSHRLIVTTGNAPFNGRTDWGDSVLMLAPAATRLLQSYTPANQEELNNTDGDLGSTTPALLPAPGGKTPRYAMQGGKDGKIRLLSLRRLNNNTGRAGPETGGEVQVLEPPRGELAFTTPAVWRVGKRVLLFTADSGATVAYELRGSPPRLHVLWDNDTSGSSPVLAGGLLYVYDIDGGALDVYRPRSGRRVATLPAGSGHWNSPIVVDGRIALPEGDANDQATSGVLDIWSR